jgi:hypothetical protein
MPFLSEESHVMVRSLVVLVGMSAFLTTAASRAEQAVFNQLYGNGVHAYFAGNYRQAYEQLTSAIQGGTQDPRAYYFRGLTYLKLGRPQEAAADFQRGAEWETKDVNQRFNVPRALERVQGEVRQQLETYRMEARKVAFEEAKKIRKARYEAIRREEQRVLQSQVEAAKRPPDIPAEFIPTPPATAEKKAAAAPTTETVSAPGIQPPAVTPPEKKIVAEKEANPFEALAEEKPKVEEEPGGGGSSAAAPAPAKSEGKKKILGPLEAAIRKALSSGVKPSAGAGTPSPFGPGTGVNPFGTPEKPNPPPAKGEEAPAGVNPFGETPAVPNEKPSGEKAESKAPENPFLEGPASEKKAPEKKAPEKKPAEEPVPENPFGG